MAAPRIYNNLIQKPKKKVYTITRFEWSLLSLVNSKSFFNCPFIVLIVYIALRMSFYLWYSQFSTSKYSSVLYNHSYNSLLEPFNYAKLKFCTHLAVIPHFLFHCPVISLLISIYINLPNPGYHFKWKYATYF